MSDASKIRMQMSIQKRLLTRTLQHRQLGLPPTSKRNKKNQSRDIIPLEPPTHLSEDPHAFAPVHLHKQRRPQPFGRQVATTAAAAHMQAHNPGTFYVRVAIGLGSCYSCGTCSTGRHTRYHNDSISIRV